MSRTVITNDIKCPFFKAIRDRSIVCESPVVTAVSTLTFFKTQSKKYSHILWHCNEIDGAGCPIYRAVQQKYGGEDGGGRGVPDAARGDGRVRGRKEGGTDEDCANG